MRGSGSPRGKNQQVDTAGQALGRLALQASPMQAAARQLLRAIRGRRSQVAFARRLGYRGNPITDWERGVRHPTAKEALRAAWLLRLDVLQAFSRMSSQPPPRLGESMEGLSVWLDGLRGAQPIVQLSAHVGRSRYVVGRWLSGKTEPRLYEWLELVDAITGRVHDFVAALVPIEQVPALLQAHRRAEAARRIAFHEPWTEAVLRVVETEHYRSAPAPSLELLSTWLGADLADLERALEGLVQAGVLGRTNEGYHSLRALSVDTRADPSGLRALQRHWLGVATARTANPREGDWFAYNVISCSQEDLHAIQELLKRTFRESRAVVAASKPSEAAGLMVMGLIRWQPPQ